MNRALQLCCSLAVIELAACFSPVSERNDSSSSGSTAGAETGGNSTGGTTGAGSGTTTGTNSGTGTTGGGGNSTTSGGGSGTTGGAPDAGIGDAGIGEPCVQYGPGSDSCSTPGLVCGWAPNGVDHVCQLPMLYEGPCLPEVGCALPELRCVLEPFYFPYRVCVLSCQGDWDCVLLEDRCQTLETEQVCTANQCEGSFEICDGGIGVGTCLPSILGLICMAGGQATAGQSCAVNRTIASQVCAANLVCIPDCRPGEGTCAPICGLGDAGPVCAGQTSCQHDTKYWGYCY